MDISSAEPGSNAGEPKSTEIENKVEASPETPASKMESDPVVASGGSSPESEEAKKVIAYGPAQRDPEPPEIKMGPNFETGKAPEIKAEKDPSKDPMANMTAKKETVTATGSSLVPFVAKAKEETAEKPAAAEPRAPRFEFLRSRGMQAAMIAALVGVSWAFAGSMFTDHSVPVAPQQAAAIPAAPEARRPPAQVADNSETRRLNDEIRALKKELDGLRSSVAQNSSAEEIRSLKKSVDSLKNGLEGTKSEVNNTLAQLSSKLEKAQHDPAKLREIVDRLDHIEHAAPMTTASIAPQPEAASKPVQAIAAPLPPAKPQSVSQPQSQAAIVKPVAPSQTSVPATSSEKPVSEKVASEKTASEKSQAIPNWVVRDVYDGIALVEGPHGSVEVIEGETIPGVGTVKSIEKRGSGWIVVTSRGLVDSARN